MGALLEGVLLGLTLAFVFGFGPAFFALIQTTLYRGTKEGLLLAVGIFLNDVFVVILALIGSVSLLPHSANYKLMGVIGGSLLIVFGIATLLHKAKSTKSGNKQNENPHRIIFIGKGFLLNLANPFVWIFWLTVVVGATASYKGNTSNMIIFFSATLAMIIITDTIKVFTAALLKKFINNKFLAVINKIAGIGLILFGIVLILRALFDF